MANFSCYVNIKNESEIDLIDGKCERSYGKYDSKPTTTLVSGDSTKFRLKDKSGPAGSTGYTTYKTASGGEIKLNYDCPYGSGDNKLYCNKNTTGLEVFIYGKNSNKYLDNIPSNSNGKLPKSGHPLSGIFVIKDPLSAGWDIISAMKIDILNNKIENLYHNEAIPHTLDNVNIQCPEVYIENKKLKVKVILDGRKLIDISGVYSFDINLDNIEISIEKSEDSYNLLINFNRNIISSIDTPKAIISKILEDILKKISSPIKIPLNLKAAVSLDNVVIDFKLIADKNIFAIMINFDGKTGSRNLSSDIIYNGDNCDISYVLSNHFIMKQLKGAVENTLNIPSDELVLTNNYPGVIYNKNTHQIDSVDHVWLKIKKDDMNVYINDDGSLFARLTVKWWNVATLGQNGSTEVDITFSFSVEDGNIAVKVSKKIDTNAPWWFWLTPVLIMLKGTVESIINKIFVNPLLRSLGDSVISIPNFEVVNCVSPSYIRVSGKVKKKTKCIDVSI